MVLPDQNLPEDKKDKEWHLRMLEGFVMESTNNSVFTSERIKAHNNYLALQGHFDPKQYEYMTDIGTKTAPVRFTRYPIIIQKFDLMAGELVMADLEISCHVVNRNAVARKIEQQVAVAAETVMRPIRREMEEVLGVKFEDEDAGHEIPKDVEAFSNMKFRDAKEQMVLVGLDHLKKQQHWKQTFKRGLYDGMATSKEFYHTCIRNKNPYIKRIDPRSIFYDAHADVENIADARWAGHEALLTVPEIMETYDLDDDTIAWLLELQQMDQDAISDINRESNFTNFFIEPNKALKIRVTHVEWKDMKFHRYKVSPNTNDPVVPYVKKLGKKDRPVYGKDKIVKKKSYSVRYAVKMGNRLVDWGILRERVAKPDNYADCCLNYFGYIKGNFNGTTLSMGDIILNLQEFYDIVMFNIKLTMQRAGGKAVVYDMAQKPRTMSWDDVQYHTKYSGIIPINSRQEGNQFGGGGFNQYQNIDLTLSNALGQLLNMKVMIEETVDRLTGISPARSGFAKDSELVGVNNANIINSSLVTAPLLDLHYDLVGRVLTQVANLMGIAWKGEEKILPIFGDTLTELFKISPDLGLDYYGIVVENSSKEKQNKDVMIQLINAYAANGTVDPLTAMKAVNASSAREIESMMESYLQTVKDNELAMEERKVAAQEKTNEIAERKITVPIEVQKIKSETELQLKQMDIQGKGALNKQTLEHNENMQQAERNTKLDEIMLETANAETAHPIKPEKPQAKKPAAKK